MSEIDSKALLSLLADKSSHKETDSMELLKSLITSAVSEKKSVATPEKLKTLFEKYNKKYEFKIGDIVQWKKEFMDRKLPLEDEPAIVIEVLDQAIHDSQDDAGSHYFREPYDIRLGVLQPDGTFTAFYYNSRRFEPYPE